MNKQDYRAQVDAVSFSPDFRDRTMTRLMDLAREKEKKTVKKLNWKTGLVAAAIAAVLLVSACAVTVLLRPQDVARRVGNEALAAAFEGESAIEVNETKTVGDYDVTFMGMVSGEGLSGLEQLPGGVSRARTYAVLAYTLTDGVPFRGDELMVDCLVEGYAPWLMNGSALEDTTGFIFAQEGVGYYLFECDSLEAFADHTVYLEVAPNTFTAPYWALVDFDETTGTITPKGDVVLFTLPLDETKADPERAQAIVDSQFQWRPGPWEDPDQVDSQTAVNDIGDEQGE